MKRHLLFPFICPALAVSARSYAQTEKRSLGILEVGSAQAASDAIATAMTAAIGQEIGRAIYIYEYESLSDSYRPVMMKAMSNVDSMAGENSSEDLDFKGIKVSCSVTVRFSLPE